MTITPSEGEATGATEVDVVTSFLDALRALDVDRAVGHAAPGILYQNVSLPSVRGDRAFARALGLMARLSTGFEVEVHRIAAEGPVVLTERTDILVLGRLRIRFWVCGTFEVHDGRITLWRDYFDWAAFLFGVGRGLVGMVTRPRRP